MKKLITLICFAISISSDAQNGGQAQENNVCRVDFIGYAGNEYYFKITNKQNCTASYKVSYPNLDSIVSIPAHGTLTIEVEIVSGSLFKVKAEAATACTNQPDMGWVEVTGLVVLALRDNYLYGRPRTNDEMKIYPNPFTGNITIKVKNELPKPYTVTITNIAGTKEIGIYTSSNEMAIPMNKEERGLYILELRDGNDKKIQTSLIIKQ